MKPLLPWLLLTTLGVVIYHLAQKIQPNQSNPMVLLMGVYGVSFLLAALAAPLFRTTQPLSWSAQLPPVPVLLLGLGVFLIELGFLLFYRAGGSLQWGGVAVNGLAALLLVPAAILWFRESLHPVRLAGMLLTLLGLVLMASKRG